MWIYWSCWAKHAQMYGGVEDKLLSGWMCDGKGFTAGFIASFAVSQCGEIHPFLKDRIKMGTFGSCRMIHAVKVEFDSKVFLLLTHICWRLLMAVQAEQTEHDLQLLMLHSLGVFLGDLIYKWWQRGLLVAGVVIVLLVLTWKDACGRGADRWHKEPLHQAFTVTWNFTYYLGKCGDGPALVQVKTFFFLNLICLARGRAPG